MEDESCKPSGSKTKVKNDEIKYIIEEDNGGTCPSYTFLPTEEQIRSFPHLIELIEQTDAPSRCGVVKIVPPPKWKPRSKGYGNINNHTIYKPVYEHYEKLKNGMYTKDVSSYKSSCTWEDLQKFARHNKLDKSPCDVRDRREVDRIFWNTIDTSDPIYGADTEGSLFDDNVNEFNMHRLGTILDDLQSEQGIRISGVNTVYMYFGMWRTMFPWHAEDMDLYSINYLHHGAPKHWWSIPPEASALFERLMGQLFKEDFNKCPAFMRHKNFIATPQLLESYGIPYALTTQNKNEFIITFPKGYHMGYNTGLNIAESTNFASDRWVDFAKNVTMCQCKSQSVTFKMNSFMAKYRESEYNKWFNYWYAPEPNIEDRKFRLELIGKRFKVNPKEEYLWSNSQVDFYNERQYNESRSQCYPYCCVCQFFIPEEICMKSMEVPKCSRRYVRNTMFRKHKPSSTSFKVEEEDDEDDDDPKEDILIKCINCNVTVHPSCYANIELTDQFKCMRCLQKDDFKIRHVSCALCELRGGAYIKGWIGKTQCFIHITCAITHRRTWFMEPSMRLTSFSSPPSRYGIYPYMKHFLSDEYMSPSVYPSPYDTFNSKYQCSVCNQIRDGLLVCHGCIVENEDVPEVVHASCARMIGMRIERRRYPHIAVLYCHRHSLLPQRIPIGTEVMVDDTKGVIEGYDDIESNGGIDQLIVDFYDDTRSWNVLPVDILDCSCHGCNKTNHTIDSPVVVQWNDGMKYSGYYRGIAQPKNYIIRFSSIGVVSVDSEEVEVVLPPRLTKEIKSPKKKMRKRTKFTLENDY